MSPRLASSSAARLSKEGREGISSGLLPKYFNLFRIPHGQELTSRLKMIFTSPAPNTCIRQCGYDRGCPALKAEYIYYMADPSSLHRPALFPFIAGTTAWVYIIHSFVYFARSTTNGLGLIHCEYSINVCWINKQRNTFCLWQNFRKHSPQTCKRGHAIYLGWDGEGGGRGFWDGGHMYTCGWFMSMYGKNHHKIVK